MNDERLHASPNDLCALLRGYRFKFETEVDLQDGIASLLDDQRIVYLREYRLSPKDRVDFLIGSIALEVKVAAGLTTLTRQLWRYAQSDEVESIVLVTTRSRHRQLPPEINNKPLHVVALEVAF